jgi:hypothetical protein
VEGRRGALIVDRRVGLRYPGIRAGGNSRHHAISVNRILLVRSPRIVMLLYGDFTKNTGVRAMSRTFNALMRVVSTLIGLAMIAMGSVWILQGLNLAFRVGFMVGDKHWTLYGAILALVGIGQVIWSNTRQRQG